MAEIRTLTLPWSSVATKSTSDAFYPATGWLPAGGVEKVRPSLELAARTNDLTVALGYQTGNVSSSPDSANSLTNASASSDTVAFGSDFDDISANTKGKQLIRFGFIVKNATSTDLSTGRVAGTVDVRDA